MERMCKRRRKRKRKRRSAMMRDIYSRRVMRRRLGRRDVRISRRIQVEVTRRFVGMMGERGKGVVKDRDAVVGERIRKMCFLADVSIDCTREPAVGNIGCCFTFDLSRYILLEFNAATK
jgi:hypothetical protein